MTCPYSVWRVVHKPPQPAAGRNGNGRQAPQADAPLLLRARDVARLLGLSERKVRLMMATGELPVVRVGRAVRVRAADLEAWVAGLTDGSDHEP